MQARHQYVSKKKRIAQPPNKWTKNQSEPLKRLLVLPLSENCEQIFTLWTGKMSRMWQFAIPLFCLFFSNACTTNICLNTLIENVLHAFKMCTMRISQLYKLGKISPGKKMFIIFFSHRRFLPRFICLTLLFELSVGDLGVQEVCRHTHIHGEIYIYIYIKIG